METLSRLKPCSSLDFNPLKSIHPSRNRPYFNGFLEFQRDQFGQNFRSHGLNHSFRFRKQLTTHRNTVVRSELTMPGSPNACYSTKEFQLSPIIRGICFYALSATTAIFLFIAMVAAHPFVVMFDRSRRQFHHKIAKIWATLTIAPFYKLELEGLENMPPHNSPAVYVSNHQSFLDTYTLLTLGRSFKFISKTAIFLIPIIGWAMFLMGLIPLRRMDSRSQLDCLKRCMDLVRKGASVFFFPEGTRSKDGKLGVFKKGAFSVAAKTGAPIVPITLLGTGKLMPAGMENILNSGSVKVIIHKPVKGTDAETLCKQARNVIADTLLLHGYGVHISMIHENSMQENTSCSDYNVSNSSTSRATFSSYPSSTSLLF